jgi:hypothetical protein
VPARFILRTACPCQYHNSPSASRWLTGDRPAFSIARQPSQKYRIGEGAACGGRDDPAVRRAARIDDASAGAIATRYPAPLPAQWAATMRHRAESGHPRGGAVPCAGAAARWLDDPSLSCGPLCGRSRRAPAARMTMPARGSWAIRGSAPTAGRPAEPVLPLPPGGCGGRSAMRPRAGSVHPSYFSLPRNSKNRDHAGLRAPYLNRRREHEGDRISPGAQIRHFAINP